MLVHVLAITTAAAAYSLVLIGGPGAVLTVAILTVLLAALITASRKPHLRALRRNAWLSVGLVLVQAVLGGITVKLRLPAPVSTAHTGVSLLVFLSLLDLAFRTRVERSAGAAPAPLSDRAVRVALVSAVMVYFQMLLGGLVRYSAAALACSDLPLCHGATWPNVHPNVYPNVYPNVHPAVLIHVLHRINALCVAAVVIASSIETFRAARRRPGLRVLALAAPVLVLGEITLGAMSVMSFLDLATVESHLAVATALLATQVAIVLAGRAAPDPAAASSPWPTWVIDMVRLTKPRITGLVIATFGGGLWLAPGDKTRWRVIMTLIGTALIVAASNTLNMFLERDADTLMARTRDRPLPRGRVSPEAALVFGAALACAALPLLFLAGNVLTGLLAGLALFSYVVVYTPMKRRSAAALFVGAVPGAIPPLMGWTAATGQVQLPGLVLFSILFFWQLPHFLAIAIYRSNDYARAGFKVLPAAVSTRVTRVYILVFSGVLVVSTVLLQPLRMAGARYELVAALLGAVLLGWGLAGFRRAAAAAWARSLFLFSIVYLTLLFVALVVDAAPGMTAAAKSGFVAIAPVHPPT